MTPSLKAIVERCESCNCYGESSDDFADGFSAENARLMPIILELLSIVEERGKALQNLSVRHNWSLDFGECICREHLAAHECLDSTTKRLEHLGLGEGK